MPAARIRPETALGPRARRQPGSSPTRLRFCVARERRTRSMCSRRKSATRTAVRELLGGGEQEAVALGLPLDVREVGVDRRGEPPRASRALPAAAGAPRLSSLDVALGQRLVEAVLVAEVAVEDRLRDTRLGRDLLHRRVAPAAADDPVGRVEQLLAPQLAPARRAESRMRDRVAMPRTLTLSRLESQLRLRLRALRRLQVPHDRRSTTPEEARRTPPGSTNMITIRITPKTTDGACFESSHGMQRRILGVDREELEEQRAEDDARRASRGRR